MRGKRSLAATGSVWFTDSSLRSTSIGSAAPTAWFENGWEDGDTAGALTP
jgi:hypothetical protein